LAKELAVPQGFFGRASAPLVLGQNVLLGTGGESDGKGAAAAAFDAATGKIVWQAGRQDPGYASPILLDDKTTAVFFLREGLLGVDTKKGQEVFSVPFRAEMEASVNASTPIALEGGKFFATASYAVGCGLWQWSGGNLKNLWKKEDALDCHYGTPVLHGKHLYGMHGRQETGQELRCLDVETGTVKWKSGRTAAADIILVGETLLLVTDKGELILAKASSESYQELDRAQILTAGHRSPPAFVGGVLYVRDKQKLIAVQLTSPNP
jgi:outer membrane protein assembly factor BamB